MEIGKFLWDNVTKIVSAYTEMSEVAKSEEGSRKRYENIFCQHNWLIFFMVIY